MGGLLSTMSAGLKHLPQTTIPADQLPRLGDFAMFGKRSTKDQDAQKGFFKVFQPCGKPPSREHSTHPPWEPAPIGWRKTNQHFSGTMKELLGELKILNAGSAYDDNCLDLHVD